MAKETMEVLDLTGLGIIQDLLKSMYIRQYVITTATDWNTLTIQVFIILRQQLVRTALQLTGELCM